MTIATNTKIIFIVFTKFLFVQNVDLGQNSTQDRVCSGLTGSKLIVPPIELGPYIGPYIGPYLGPYFGPYLPKREPYFGPVLFSRTTVIRRDPILLSSHNLDDDSDEEAILDSWGPS